MSWPRDVLGVAVRCDACEEMRLRAVRSEAWSRARDLHLRLSPECARRERARLAGQRH